MKKLLCICLIAVGTSVLSLSAEAAPLLHYTFDDLLDPTADLGDAPPAPGNLNGTSQFTTSTPGGYSAGAFDTNGGAEGNNVSGGDVNKVDGLSAFTLTTWINLQANPANNDRIISDRNGTVNDATHGYFDFSLINSTASSISATNLRLQLAVDVGPTERTYVTNNLSFGGLNTWAFVAVTYDGAGAAGDATNFFLGNEFGQVVQIGQSVASEDLAGLGTLLGNPASFAIADIGNFAGDRASDAFYDDVRVYGSVLTLAEIETVRLANVIPEPSITLAVAGTLLLLTGSRYRRLIAVW